MPFLLSSVFRLFLRISQERDRLLEGGVYIHRNKRTWLQEILKSAFPFTGQLRALTLENVHLLREPL